MGFKAAIFEYFPGGIATDVKYGIRGSAAGLQAFDVRSSPSKMTVLPASTLEDNNVVSDLILGEVMTADGTIYALGDAGIVYRRSTAGSWSVVGTLSSSGGGIDYRRDTDSVYLTGTKTVSQIANVSSAVPTLNPDIYAASYSQYVPQGVAGAPAPAPPTYQAGGSQLYTLPTAKSESGVDTRFFQTDIEPVSSISVFCVSRGTGDWTLYLEDQLDNVLATATITHANLTNFSWANFQFTSATNGQVRLYPAPNARTYHIHLKSTVADGTIAVVTAGSMDNADLQVFADRLVYPTNGLHPMVRFQQFEVIGNGNYISTWEPITFPPVTSPPASAEWIQARLTVPMEYENCGVATTNEYLVGAFEKVSSNASQSPQEGLLIFWSGPSAQGVANDKYDYAIPITEGAPYGLHTYMNVVYYYTAGFLWAVTSPTTQPVKVRQFPGTNTEFSGSNAPIKLYPMSMTTRRGIQLIGWPGSTTNTGVNFGVYSWGQTDKNYPQAFSYNYVLSTGSQNYSSSNHLRIGMVKSFDDLMHISWRDDLHGTYGIDKVDNTVGAAPTAIYQTLVVDNGYAGKYKGGAYVEAYYKLQSGCSIQFAYQFNRSGTWVTDTNSYTTSTLWQGHNSYARFPITADSSGNPAGTFREVQGQITITSPSGASSSEVYMVAVVFDDKKEEMIG